MSDNKPAGSARIGIECIIPILSIHSLSASIRYYVDVLGFKVDWGDEEASDMASVSLGVVGLFLEGSSR